MNKKLGIIGAGGHGKVVGEIALLNKYETIHFFDDNSSQIKEFPFSIVGSMDYLKEHIKDYDSFFVAIGDNLERFNKIEWLKKYETNIISLVHPKSTISRFSTFEKGCCVMANAVINPGVQIKEGVIINTSASVDHDCIIEEFAHLSPNCSLSGNVKIGKFTHLGSGTSVHPGIKVGRNVKSGVGSKIFENVLDETIYKI